MENLFGGQLPHVIWRWHVSLLSPKKQIKTNKTLQYKQNKTMNFQSTYPCRKFCNKRALENVCILPWAALIRFMLF
jgi:hypothetical protein